jgi:hypothetical protein
VDRIKSSTYDRETYLRGRMRIKKRNAVMKEKCLDYLGGKICAMCGNDGLPAFCYDFHHIDIEKGRKETDIGLMIYKAFNDVYWEKLKLELDKCIVLCSNCHKIKHWGNE